MDRKELTEQNITLGSNVLTFLDKNDFQVESALWFYDSDDQFWKYYIATHIIDNDGPIQTYTRLLLKLDEFAEWKNNIFEKNHFINSVYVLSPTNPLIKLLQPIIKTPLHGVSGIRFTGNVINGQRIEDAYIYRIT